MSEVKIEIKSEVNSQNPEDSPKPEEVKTEVIKLESPNSTALNADENSTQVETTDTDDAAAKTVKNEPQAEDTEVQDCFELEQVSSLDSPKHSEFTSVSFNDLKDEMENIIICVGNEYAYNKCPDSEKDDLCKRESFSAKRSSFYREPARMKDDFESDRNYTSRRNKDRSIRPSERIRPRDDTYSKHSPDINRSTYYSDSHRRSRSSDRSRSRYFSFRSRRSRSVDKNRRFRESRSPLYRSRRRRRRSRSRSQSHSRSRIRSRSRSYSRSRSRSRSHKRSRSRSRSHKRSRSRSHKRSRSRSRSHKRSRSRSQKRSRSRSRSQKRSRSRSQKRSRSRSHKRSRSRSHKRSRSRSHKRSRSRSHKRSRSRSRKRSRSRSRKRSRSRSHKRSRSRSHKRSRSRSSNNSSPKQILNKRDSSTKKEHLSSDSPFRVVEKPVDHLNCPEKSPASETSSLRSSQPPLPKSPPPPKPPPPVENFSRIPRPPMAINHVPNLGFPSHIWVNQKDHHVRHLYPFRNPSMPRVSVNNLPLVPGVGNLPVHITPSGDQILHDMEGRPIPIGPNGRLLPVDMSGRLVPHIEFLLNDQAVPIHMTKDGVLRLPNGKPVPYGDPNQLPVNIDGSIIPIGPDSRPLFHCPNIPVQNTFISSQVESLAIPSVNPIRCQRQVQKNSPPVAVVNINTNLNGKNTFKRLFSPPKLSQAVKEFQSVSDSRFKNKQISHEITDTEMETSSREELEKNKFEESAATQSTADVEKPKATTITEHSVKVLKENNKVMKKQLYENVDLNKLVEKFSDRVSKQKIRTIYQKKIKKNLQGRMSPEPEVFVTNKNFGSVHGFDANVAKELLYAVQGENYPKASDESSSSSNKVLSASKGFSVLLHRSTIPVSNSDEVFCSEKVLAADSPPPAECSKKKMQALCAGRLKLLNPARVKEKKINNNELSPEEAFYEKKFTETIHEAISLFAEIDFNPPAHGRFLFSKSPTYSVNQSPPNASPLLRNKIKLPFLSPESLDSSSRKKKSSHVNFRFLPEKNGKLLDRTTMSSVKPSSAVQCDFTSKKFQNLCGKIDILKKELFKSKNENAELKDLYKSLQEENKKKTEELNKVKKIIEEKNKLIKDLTQPRRQYWA